MVQQLAPETVEQIAIRVTQMLIQRLAGFGDQEIKEPTVAVAESHPDDGWLRGAEKIAAYLDCPRSRVYALASARRIAIEHDGSALIARKQDLDAWIRNGGGLRP